MTTGSVPRFWLAGDSFQIPDAPVHELFLARAKRHPDALAVRQWDQSLTYGQLAGLAATLAARLRAAGVRAGSRVGICMKRTPELPASVLGVLTAGGTFVPLDLGQPAERIRAMIGICRIESVLVDDAGRELLGGAGVQLIDAVAASASSTAEASTSDAADGPGPASGPAYVMFTSGSTGEPKGIAVSHRNLVAFASAANRCLGADPGFRVAAFASTGFDVSIFEMFTPLIGGGSIQLVPDEDRTEVHRLQRFLEAHAVTRTLLPPVLVPLLDPGRLPELRDIIAGGEPCDPAQVGRWARAGLRRFHNWYGPTEATCVVSGIELRGNHDRPLPIGRPLPGNFLYIVSEDMTM
jgi:non-ribosomal peptide synthetase component F